jgi:hypothetical protein
MFAQNGACNIKDTLVRALFSREPETLSHTAELPIHILIIPVLMYRRPRKRYKNFGM